MDSVLVQLRGDMVTAQSARGTSFLLLTGASVDTVLGDQQRIIDYLAGQGYQDVLSGARPFSTGDADAPGWLEVAQSVENTLASTVSLIGKTNLSTLASGAAQNFPTPTGGVTLIPWYWWAIGGLAVLGWTLSQGKGLAQAARGAGRPVGPVSGYSRRRAGRARGTQSAGSAVSGRSGRRRMRR